MVVGWFTFCFSMAEGLNTRDILGGISRRFPEAGWTATRSRRFFASNAPNPGKATLSDSEQRSAIVSRKASSRRPVSSLDIPVLADIASIKLRLSICVFLFMMRR